MRQRLGQHFLADPEVSERIARALNIVAGDTIIEIGPGHGELTQAIVAEISGAGPKGEGVEDTKLIAVEKDPELAEEMRQAFAAGKDPGGKEAVEIVEIIEGDILKNLEPLASRLKGAYKIAGNIPYYLTGHLLRRIGELDRPPKLTVLMIQKEVAGRLAAKPPRMNRLAAAVQFWASPEILFAVPRDSFDPPPEVDSAVIMLEAKQRRPIKADAERYYETVRALFQQPRKTIGNNLVKSAGGRRLSKEAILAALKTAGADPSGRPQDLTIGQIQKLAEELRG